MIWKIPQHIYTSTGRMNFETVAVSPEISSDTLRQLEARAQLYPDRRFWGDDATPPFLARGFQITGSKDPQYAVSLSYYVGPGLNRPEGNYLSHSYVIDSALLREQNYNLPWIAACLPCHFKYYPARGIGADQLDPFEIDLNTSDQFQLLGFVVHELTEDGLSDLTNRLVDHLSGANATEPLDLELPPPHPELSRFYQEDMGQSPEAAPGPDALRLLRLAGLFAILPASFKQNPTFIVNEGVLGQGLSGADAYALRVARSQGSFPAPNQTTRPWFDRSVKLATEHNLAELSELQAWLSSLLPKDHVPSHKIIDLGFKLDQQLTALEQEMPNRLEDDLSQKRLAMEILNEVNELENYHVNVDTIYQRVWPLLEQLKSSFKVCDAYTIFSRLAVNAPETIPDWLFKGLLDCVLPTDGREPVNRSFWKQLPKAVRARVWEQSFRERKLPGYIPVDSDTDYLTFALTSLEARFLRESIRSEIVEHLYGRLMQPDSVPLYGISEREVRSRRIWLRLSPLLSLPDGDGVLLTGLVARAVSDFTALDQHEYGEQLSIIVLKGLPQASDLGTSVLVEFATQVGLRSESAIIHLLLKLSLERSEVRKTREFLSRFETIRFGHRPASLIGVLLEMTEVLRRPGLCDTDRKDRNLPRFCDWQQSRTNRKEKEELLTRLQQQLLGALRDVSDMPDRFCIGVSYLSQSSLPDGELFSFMQRTLQEGIGQIARWSVSNSWDLVVGRGRCLASFIEVAHKFGHPYLESAIECIDHALRSLGDGKSQYILLSQLNHYLADADVPGRVKKTIREALDELKRKREPKRR